jgi:hypothetical protein
MNATAAITATLYAGGTHGTSAVVSKHDATGNGSTREAEAAPGSTAPVSCALADRERLSCSGHDGSHCAGTGLAQGDPTVAAQVVQGSVDFSRPYTKIADIPAGATDVAFSFDYGPGDQFIAVIAA